MPDTARTRTPTKSDYLVAVNPGRGRAYDAGDPRHGGQPAWPQDAAPAHLLTRRQMKAQGLRAGRQPAHGLVFWTSPNGIRCARLYDIALARPRLLRMSPRPIPDRSG
jgi:hypothetical protein